MLASVHILDEIVSNKHLMRISKEVGNDWEDLAIQLEFTFEDLDDIKEHSRDPKQQRSQMLRQWKTKLTRESQRTLPPSYSNLIKAIQNMNNVRTDLKELVQRLAEEHLHRAGMSEPKPVSAEMSNMQPIQPESTNPTRALKCEFTPSLVCLGAILFLTVCLTVLFLWCTNPPINRSELLPCSYGLGLPFPEGSDFDDSHLPQKRRWLTGREKDAREVINMLLRTHIVNIYGAIGSGKSSLAIYIGQKMANNGTPVYYINMEEKISLFMKCNSLDTQISISGEQSSPQLLKIWSDTLTKYTILILDNCDHILTNSSRTKTNFLNLALDVSQKNLHLLVVSQEAVNVINGDTDIWKLGMLDQKNSVKLLKHKIRGNRSDIKEYHLIQLANLVDGYPFALSAIAANLQVITPTVLIKQLKDDSTGVLSISSIHVDQFRIIMKEEVSRLNKLEPFKECGYKVSLFPGSFDFEASTSFVDGSCLLAFMRYSLLECYPSTLCGDTRCKMLRPFREYLKQLVNDTDKHAFYGKYEKYFKFFLKNVQGNKSLMEETHHIDLYQEMLLERETLQKDGFKFSHEEYEVLSIFEESGYLHDTLKVAFNEHAH